VSEDYSRWIFVTLVLISAIPMQAAALWIHSENSWIDWAVMASLIILGWAHLDSKTPNP
jgi:membrane protein YdbS with pleckstrin-like domain